MSIDRAIAFRTRTQTPPTMGNNSPRRYTHKPKGSAVALFVPDIPLTVSNRCTHSLLAKASGERKEDVKQEKSVAMRAPVSLGRRYLRDNLLHTPGDEALRLQVAVVLRGLWFLPHRLKSIIRYRILLGTTRTPPGIRRSRTSSGAFAGISGTANGSRGSGFEGVWNRLPWMRSVRNSCFLTPRAAETASRTLDRTVWFIVCTVRSHG